MGLFIPETDFNRADSIKRYTLAEVKAKVEGYEGREAVVQGEDFDPSFDNIDARSKRMDLVNGAQIVMLNKEIRG